MAAPVVAVDFAALTGAVDGSTIVSSLIVVGAVMIVPRLVRMGVGFIHDVVDEMSPGIKIGARRGSRTDWT